MNLCYRMPAWRCLAWLVLAVSSCVNSASDFAFRMPGLKHFNLESNAPRSTLSGQTQQWLKARPGDGSAPLVEFGSRVVLILAEGVKPRDLLDGSTLRLSRTPFPQAFIYQAADAFTAMREASRLSQAAGVIASYPVIKRPMARNWRYAAKPNDPYFKYQWNYENRDTNGTVMGPDLNIRAAWPIARGAGVTVAVADDGIELTHPELSQRVEGAPHFNFHTGEATGEPTQDDNAHGTAVAGLIAAEGYNQQGMIGAAPAARLASWILFTTGEFLPPDESMADMFQYQTGEVGVQNHSWGNAGVTLIDASPLEKMAISNAVTLGRSGRGVVMVRAGGNGREVLQDANDDGFNTTPLTIIVAAVREDGQVASYGSQGACLLVGAPSDDADPSFPTLFTTDRLGDKGYNKITFTNDFADYAFDGNGFGGTSGATPQISGLCALLLSANPGLTYRDVQQILILSARHFDPLDPDLATNGAGLAVSHNDGYGIPDAGVAARLATNWPLRPPVTNIAMVSSNSLAIPPGALRLLLSGDQVPDALTNVLAWGPEASYPDAPTGSYPLVDVGLATDALTNDLTGKAALILRGVVNFSVKIDHAAKAGAAMAVIYNRPDTNTYVHMGGTDRATIPTGFISQSDGEAIRDLLSQGNEVKAQFRLNTANYQFEVTNTLLLEQVAVRIGFDFPTRLNLRLTLLSPQGTRSVLQHYSFDDSAAPDDWTYLSTHHFFESSAGTWTLSVSDNTDTDTGSVKFASLILYGVPIKDADHDGLDDDGEMKYFHTLAFGPKDDPDGDGYSNAREQLMGTNPAQSNYPLDIDLSIWNPELLRLSWPGVNGRDYQIWAGDTLGKSLGRLTNVTGRFPETEWFTPYTNAAKSFFELRAVPKP